MKIIKQFFIVLSLLLFIFQNCGDKYIISETSNDIQSETSYETDIDFLNAIIDANNLIESTENLGIQKWENNRLVELNISDNLDLYIIPSSIKSLDNLNKLILNNNSIIHLPSNICELNINFLDINYLMLVGITYA